MVWAPTDNKQTNKYQQINYRYVRQNYDLKSTTINFVECNKSNDGTMELAMDIINISSFFVCFFFVADGNTMLIIVRVFKTLLCLQLHNV